MHNGKMNCESFVDDDDYYLEEHESSEVQLQNTDTGAKEEAVVMEDTITVEQLLISEVMRRPPLWDCRLPLKERSKTTRDNLWLEIFKVFGEQNEFTISFLIKKWRNLRDTYVRVKGEIETHTPSGSGAGKRKKRTWEYYDMMSFLSDTIKYRPTVSNIPDKKTQSFAQVETEMIGEIEAVPTFQSTPVADLKDLNTPKRSRIDKNEKINVDLALVDAINRINAPSLNSSDSKILPTCIAMSDILSKMPLKERVKLEIELMQKTYEGAQKYL